MYDAAAAGAPEDPAEGECKAGTAAHTPRSQEGNGTATSRSRRTHGERDAVVDQQTAERKARERGRKGATPKTQGASPELWGWLEHRLGLFVKGGAEWHLGRRQLPCGGAVLGAK